MASRAPTETAGHPVTVPAADPERPRIAPLVWALLRPYRGWLVIVLAAMLVEIAMSLAAPWPLKLVLDDALGNHQLPEWLDWAHEYGIGRHTLGVALFAGIATLVIAVDRRDRDLHRQLLHHQHRPVGRQRPAHPHLRAPAPPVARLTTTRAKTGTLMSTITTDVSTVQSFASSSTLGILVDLVTIVFMLGLMFWLDWDFTLIAVAVTPFLLLFVLRFKKAVKEVTRDRAPAPERTSSRVVQEGLGSVRAVKAFGRQDLEVAHMTAASHATVEAALKARQVKSLLSPVVSHRRRAVHRHRALEGHLADRRRHHDAPAR